MEDLLERPGDVAALAVFLVCWLAYEPTLRLLSRGRHTITGDMVLVRRFWMGEMVGRSRQRLLDSQLLGHALNSVSFFASSNLILIAGAAGVLFGSDGGYRVIEDAPLVAEAPPLLFSIKLGLIGLCLARGLLDFIWALRQMNYCVAVIGATPVDASDEMLEAYAGAASKVMTPALSTFTAGVRGYYFSLAAAAWLFGAAPFLVLTLGAVVLLAWRQAASPAAAGLNEVRRLLESHAASKDEPAA
jgi:uncharacterized membrane protein